MLCEIALTQIAYEELDDVSKIALAQAQLQVEGAAMFAKQQAKAAMVSLLYDGVTDQFYKYMWAAMHEKNSLTNITLGSLKSMISGDMTGKVLGYIDDAYAYLIESINAIVDQAQDAMDAGPMENEVFLKPSLKLYRLRRQALTYIRAYIAKFKHIYTAQSIVEASTNAIELGWANGTMKQAWDTERKLIPKTQYVASAPSRARPKQAKATPKATPRAPRSTAKTKIKPEGNTTGKGPLHLREQDGRLLNSFRRNGVEYVPGSFDMPHIKPYCPNFQVWNKCAVPNCKLHHKCSKCFVTHHGRRVCPLGHQ